jgi:putative ABC transport system permease protein
MTTTFQDLSFAMRVLSKRAGLSAVIVVTLALGIGANTAIFSVVNAVILKPLPFRDADRLVHIWESYPKGSRYRWGSEQGYIIVRPGTYFDWKNQSQSFERISAYGWRNVLAGGGDKNEMLPAHEVEEGLFETLGVTPILGRVFRADDYAAADGRSVILSHQLWESRFAADRQIVGKTISLDNAAHVVIGVMPPGFYATRTDTPRLWLPLSLTPEQTQSRVSWRLSTFARLKSGVSLEQAQREMDVISDRLTAAYPAHYDNMCAVLTPVTGYLFSHYEKLFSLLMGAVGLVLLIACANVANLLLARAAERSREVSVRTALGASRARIVRQLLTESLLLAGAGSIAGIGIALAGIRPILALLPAASRIPRIGEVGLELPVLLFMVAVSLGAGLLFGVLPAIHGSRADLATSLKEGGRANSSGAGARRLGDALVVSEVAISLVLLTAAAVLTENFLRLMKSDPGFNPDNVLAISVNVPVHRYGRYETAGPNASRARLYEELETRLARLPGVKSAAVTGSLPLRHGPNPWSMHIEGKPAPPPNTAAYGGGARNKKTGLYNHGDVSIQRVTPDYFKTFEIPLLKGRYFDARDRAGAPNVALINETNARKYFGNDEPVGKTIVIDMTSYFPRLTVVGVVADSRLNALDRDVYPQVFWPMAQWPSSGGWVALRTAADPDGIATAARQAIREIDQDLVIPEIATMRHVVGDSLWRQRLTAVLLGSFAALAAIMAGAGIYSVFSYLVTRRFKELGVRVALGASRPRILTLVVGSALRLALTGIAIGTVGAVLLGLYGSEWFFGVSGVNTRIIAAVALLLGTTALTASLIPAYRATRVDPMTALRQE